MRVGCHCIRIGSYLSENQRLYCDKTGVKVHTADIAQVKKKYGLDVCLKIQKSFL